MTGIGAAMAGGNPRLGRQDDDYYPTPGDVTRALLRAWRPQSTMVWECACGDGQMASEILDAGYPVVATDLIDRGFGEFGVDFLATRERMADCIITNPPFDIAASFIEHAFTLGVTEMAMVLKSSYWQAKRRYPLWQRHQPAMIMPLLWRPDFLKRGAPTMEVMWTVWSANHQGPTQYIPLERPEMMPANDTRTLKMAHA